MLRYLTATSSLALLLLACFLRPVANAQVASGAGSISGDITDSSASSIAEAAVNVVNIATGIARSTTTDSAGRYHVLSLSPGEYRVEVRKNGFRAVIQSGIEITIGRAAVINV